MNSLFDNNNSIQSIPSNVNSRVTYSQAAGATAATSDAGTIQNNVEKSGSKATTGLKRVILGRSKNSLQIESARDLTKKKYFFVGNLAVSCSVDKLRDHLSSFGIETLKCDRTNSKYKNSSAFHICINAQHIPSFIDPDHWPHHTVIREWVFKPKEAKEVMNPGNKSLSNLPDTVNKPAIPGVDVTFPSDTENATVSSDVRSVI